LWQLKQGVVMPIADEDALDSVVHVLVEIKQGFHDCRWLASPRHYNVALITADRPFRERAVPNQRIQSPKYPQPSGAFGTITVARA
jgi:hypothetical protein